MRLATVEQSKKIDELAQKDFQLPGEILMEAAAVAVAKELELSYYPELQKKRCVIVCGPGNNGGDGLAVARILHSSEKLDVTVYAADSGSDLMLKQRSRLANLGITIKSHQEFTTEDHDYSVLLVDALFGTGLSKPIGEPLAQVVDKINQYKTVVSVDSPSGLNADDGVVWGEATGNCVRANCTISIGIAKPGFYLNQGPEYCGRIRVVNIGFPVSLKQKIASTHFGFDHKLAKKWLPIRGDESNKAKNGRLLVMAGSEPMPGAGYLSCQGAFRSGAGYVEWLQPAKHFFADCAEVILADESRLDQLKSVDAVVIGPGLSDKEKIPEWLLRLKSFDGPVVVDASALSYCEPLLPFPAHWVVTPHAGELGRIIGQSASWIEQNRFLAIEQAHRAFGCNVLLKGFRTIVHAPSLYSVVMSGNSSLAKAGSGDVLSGMIGAFLAQGVEPFWAANLAAFIHGDIADSWVRGGRDKLSLNPSDILDVLPSHLHQLRL